MLFLVASVTFRRGSDHMKLYPVIVCLGGALVAGLRSDLQPHRSDESAGSVAGGGGNGSAVPFPAVLTYELTPQQRKSDGCFHVRRLVAHWTSGAVAGPSQPISLCGNYISWTLTIDRPAGTSGLEQDLAAGETRKRELKLARINEEITRLEAQARAASSMKDAGYAMGCAIAGGCPNSPRGSLGTDWSGYGSPPPAPYQSPSMAPDGTFVMGRPALCPDGIYVGAGGCSLAPDGSYVGGRPQIAPNGTYVGGPPMICPDGTYVGGSRCVKRPTEATWGLRETLVYHDGALEQRHLAGSRCSHRSSGRTTLAGI